MHTHSYSWAQPESYVHAAEMPSGHADWCLLPEDVWRKILVHAHGGLVPLRASSPTFIEDHRAWEAWWTLVARVACSCRHLRSALLGPESGELWSFVSFTMTYLGPPHTKRHSKGLRRLLRGQAHLARSAFIWGSGQWGMGRSDARELSSCVAALTSVQDLTLSALSSASYTNIGAHLGGMPTSIRCCREALWECLSPAAHGQLTRANVAYTLGNNLTVAEVHKLAQQLIRLQELELRVPLGCGVPSALGLLPLLPPVVLHLQLGSLHAGAAFRQLAESGVQLRCLRVAEGPREFLHVSDEQLLARCRISELLVMVFLNPARRLQHVPAGVAVRYDRWPAGVLR